jgi:hypothetical protein
MLPRLLLFPSIVISIFSLGGPIMAQPYTYREFMRQGGCIDQSGNVRSSSGYCDPNKSRESYSRHINHLRSVGCIDAYGYVIQSLFCLNTEPSL